jgi:hypothetical protein
VGIQGSYIFDAFEAHIANYIGLWRPDHDGYNHQGLNSSGFSVLVTRPLVVANFSFA